jgi:hypothetical protein
MLNQEMRTVTMSRSDMCHRERGGAPTRSPSLILSPP